MGYVETLFGHQDPVTSIDALRGETAISAGGQDKTVRYWKIVDETQLVFRGGGRSKVRELLEEGVVPEATEDIAEGSKKSVKQQEGFVEGRIDCVAMLDETTFLSGGDSGSISLWSTTKKKPLFSQPLAHGIEEHVSEYEPSSVKNPRWITSIAALPYSDLFASGACLRTLRSSHCIDSFCSSIPTGSWDGKVRLWKLDRASASQNAIASSSSFQSRSFSHLYDIEIPGVINSLQFVRTPVGALHDHVWLKRGSFASAPNALSVPGKEQDILLVVGVGQEPRLGRWLKVKDGGARNATIIFALTRRPSAVNAIGEDNEDGNDAGEEMSEDEPSA